MKKTVIVDYHLGNLFSVQQACNYAGGNAVISSDKKDLAAADLMILPGVGAFGDAMQTLNELDLVAPIKDHIAAGKPFMGVCLGLQLLFTESEEFGNHRGLGIIEGTTRRFPATAADGSRLKTPQIEWNNIWSADTEKWAASPLRHCANGDYMYFVHSLYVIPTENNHQLTTTEYGGISYCSSIMNGNVFACQFHPEKSGEAGISIYRNFLNQ